MVMKMMTIILFYGGYYLADLCNNAHNSNFQNKVTKKLHIITVNVKTIAFKGIYILFHNIMTHLHTNITFYTKQA